MPKKCIWYSEDHRKVGGRGEDSKHSPQVTSNESNLMTYGSRRSGHRGMA